MKLSTSCGFAFSLVAVLISGSALPGSLTAAQVQAQQDVDVIVIMRDQLTSLPGTRGSREARSSALASAQSPIVSELQRAGARKTRSFALINALATTVSKAEAIQLASHPLVQAVVPDRVIRAPKRSEIASVGRASNAASTSAAANPALCNTLEPEALQLMHAAYINPATPQAQRVIDGNGLPVTGTGVKVAYLADGLDPNIPGFIRADGSHVFIDYQDFSGDPAGTQTQGGEAFGDASSIAAQDVSNNKTLTYDISQFVNAAHPLPSPCKIRVRGIAPGASLVGLKIYGELGYGTTSNIVQAIEYAVLHDDVDVINESFGGAPFPDNSTDPVSLANAAAVRAGVTVVAATGDAGTAGTLGSPSTDPLVISAAASTSFRLYAQTTFGAIALTPSGGFISNNVSSLSSGGFSQTGALTPSVIAPGDLGWALCSTNPTLYTDCLNFAGTATPIEDFGGTSEASPLTAGTAALVIQAYRSTHGGVSPAPALVKQIIMSTAADIGAPAFEQGAGLVNALAAVNAALSVQDGNGRPTALVGDSLLNSPSLLSITDAPGAQETRTFTVTNTGSTTQHLSPVLQTLGAPFAGATIDVKLHPANDPTFLNPAGAPRSYVSRTITVPAGTQHLDAAIAFKTSPPGQDSPFVYFALIDPSGREATYSEPQGADSGYTHSDVVAPAAGTWTVYVWTRPHGFAGSYTGTDVQFTWAAERYVSLGSLQPTTLTLAPGQSANLTAQFTMPTHAGDQAAAIRFGQSADLAGTSQAEIPISLRTLVQTGPTGGTFSGTLTGGNGRPGTGPTTTYAFNVPAGVQNMSLVLNIPDSGYFLEGLLVDPQGMQLSVQSNVDAVTGAPDFGLQLDRFNPQPGRWRFVLLQNYFISGKQTSLPFSARIGFNTAEISAANLPNSTSTKLHAGVRVAVPVTVTNNGSVGEVYFADARLATLSSTQLQNGDPTACGPPGTSLPGICTTFVLPTEVSSVQFVAQGGAPIGMDAFNDAGSGANGLVGATGSPDLYAKQVGPNTVMASLSAPEIPFGIWLVIPSDIGPYPSSGAPSVPVTASAFALMQPFDPATKADSGDAWELLTTGGGGAFNPLALAPGQVGVINVSIKPPTSAIGTTVNGYLYIDTFNFDTFTGDEVVRIPYSYTVVK